MRGVGAATDHAYDEDKAGSVFAAAVAFVGDARDLLDRLREAFEESDLPIRVDVVDWRTAGPAIRAAVERRSVVLQESGPRAARG